MIFFEKHGVEEKNTFCSFELKNQSFPPHFHRAFELILVNEGKLIVTVDQKDFVLVKEHLAFIFPNQIHEFKTIGNSKITVILFSPELVSDFYMNYKGLIPLDNILLVAKKTDHTKLDTVYSQKSFLYALCGDMVHSTSFTPVKQSPQMTVLYKILLYVERQYSAECTLKTVARYLQYDYQYLSKLFAQLMNMTFTDYLNHYRIIQAEHLLNNTRLSVSEVATRSGYNNLRTFHRNFKKITGRAPKDYRNI